MSDYDENIRTIFEWPQENQIPYLFADPTVRIKKIDIWDEGSNIPSLHSIRVTLSNGMQSPIFGAEGKMKNMKTLTINKEVKTLEIGTSGSEVGGLKFKDKNQEVIAKWREDYMIWSIQ